LSCVIYTNTNSKCINDLNVSSNIQKLLEENIEEALHGTGTGNNFLDKMSKAYQTKPKTDK
jgi:hypothetical protein